MKNGEWRIIYDLTIYYLLFVSTNKDLKLKAYAYSRKESDIN